MACYIGLDVSDKSTHLCAVDEAGAMVWRGVCATDPETISRTIRRHCRDVVRVVLETGALSAFLYHGLKERGIAVVCVCARHAKGVLSTRVNKSDPHDAEGVHHHGAGDGGGDEEPQRPGLGGPPDHDGGQPADNEGSDGERDNVAG